ncbi:MAG: cupin domain-containing protein [Gammaproteobacteria bacterium]|nr:cupin domain-containing protein [Gammaproteobacteria bacterium]
MTIDGEEVTVKKGDMILNPAGGKHGLLNSSDGDIDLLVIQIDINEQAITNLFFDRAYMK